MVHTYLLFRKKKGVIITRRMHVFYLGNYPNLRKKMKNVKSQFIKNEMKQSLL